MQDKKFDNSFISTIKDSHRDISTTISNSSSNIQNSVVVVSEKRRRFSAQEKLELVRLTYLPGNIVSSIARAYSVTPSLLFK